MAGHARARSLVLVGVAAQEQRAALHPCGSARKRAEAVSWSTAAPAPAPRGGRAAAIRTDTRLEPATSKQRAVSASTRRAAGRNTRRSARREEHRNRRPGQGRPPEGSLRAARRAELVGAHLLRLRSSLARGEAQSVSVASGQRVERAHRPSRVALAPHQTPRNLRVAVRSPVAWPAASSPLSCSPPPSGEKPSGSARGHRTRQGRPLAVSHGDGDGEGAASQLPHSLADSGSGDGVAARAGGTMPATTAAAAAEGREATQLGVGGPSAPPQSSRCEYMLATEAQRVRRGGAGSRLRRGIGLRYPWAVSR